MKLNIHYFYNKRGHGDKYQGHAAEVRAGETLTFRHPGGVATFTVPGKPGHHIVTATTDHDGGPVRVVAEITVKA